MFAKAFHSQIKDASKWYRRQEQGSYDHCIIPSQSFRDYLSRNSEHDGEERDRIYDACAQNYFAGLGLFGQLAEVGLDP